MLRRLRKSGIGTDDLNRQLKLETKVRTLHPSPFCLALWLLDRVSLDLSLALSDRNPKNLLPKSVGQLQMIGLIVATRFFILPKVLGHRR
jgi:hypothetical protein